MDVNSVHMNHIIFSLFKQSHINIYIFMFKKKKKALPHHSNKYLILPVSTSQTDASFCKNYSRFINTEINSASGYLHYNVPIGKMFVYK